MSFDPRWKNPIAPPTIQNLYLWAQDIIRELRKGDYIAGVEASINDPWSLKAIGETVRLRDDLTGVDPPPTDRTYRYIKLTAGEDGTGGYNEGALGNESVSGSAPDIDATAEIILTDSPLFGETVRLINTTREFERPGDAGTVQADAFRAHSHGYLRPDTASGGDGGSPSIESRSGQQTDPEGGDETRPRNIGVTVYMRIK